MAAADPPPFYIWRNGPVLAQAVRTTRESLGMSQGQLAARARVGRKFVYEIERGKETLRADKIFAVLVVLELVPVLLPAAVLSNIGNQGG